MPQRQRFVQDMLQLLATAGPCEDCMNCTGDLNGDCQIDSGDLVVMFAGWGACP